MSFLSKIFRIFGNNYIEGSNTVETHKIGNKEPVCPYCSCILDKMPGRKKKCPSCSQFIYVRTCYCSISILYSGYTVIMK